MKAGKPVRHEERPLRVLYRILILLCMCVPVLSFTKKNKKQSRPQVTESNAVYQKGGAQLPEFRVMTLKGDIITNANVKNDANLFVMIFNPTCEHCAAMTVAIEKSSALFKKSKVLMVIPRSLESELGTFEKGAGTDKYPMLVIGSDTSRLIDKLYNYENIPHINIYDHERKLIKTLNGQETIDSLKPYIE